MKVKKCRAGWEQVLAIKNSMYKVEHGTLDLVLQCDANPYHLVCRVCKSFAHDGICKHVLAVTHLIEAKKPEGERDQRLNLKILTKPLVDDDGKKKKKNGTFKPGEALLQHTDISYTYLHPNLPIALPLLYLMFTSSLPRVYLHPVYLLFTSRIPHALPPIYLSHTSRLPGGANVRSRIQPALAPQHEGYVTRDEKREKKRKRREGTKPKAAAKKPKAAVSPKPKAAVSSKPKAAAARATTPTTTNTKSAAAASSSSTSPPPPPSFPPSRTFEDRGKVIDKRANKKKEGAKKALMPVHGA